MKATLTLITLIGVILVGSAAIGVLDAGAATFDMGGGSMIATSGTDDVLRLNVVQMNPDLDNILFNLDVGESYSFPFATIGTTETWINRDDVQPGEVTAVVDFDIPVVSQGVEIGGATVGFSAFWHFVQGWNLEWDDPVQVVLGSGLDFTVALSDVNYLGWFWQGPDGTADISATVTLNRVPLPAPLYLLSTGLIGLIGLRRRFGF